jgi:hypothetical protein
MRTALVFLAMLLGAAPALAQRQTAAPASAPSQSQGAATPAKTAPPALFPKAGYVVYSFRDLGVAEGLRLVEGDAQGGLTYMVRRDQVVTAARLHLILANSAGFPDGTRLEVTVNGDPVGSVDVGAAQHAATPVNLPVDPILLSDYNRIGFRLSGVAPAPCRVGESGPWMTIGSASAVDIAADRLPLANDLAILPLPFFDDRDPHAVRASFVFARPPDTKTLEAAGIVASWLGGLAGYRGVHLPALFGAVPTGNAIVFAMAGDSLPGLQLPRAVGPTVALIANPVDPSGKLLLVMGAKADDLKAAAAALALDRHAIRGGDVSAVLPPSVPARIPYDAPAWIPDRRNVKFGAIAPASQLQSRGLFPEPIRIDFRSAPDYFNWVDSEIPMMLRFGISPEKFVDLQASRLDVNLNGSPFASVPLAESGSLFQGMRPVHQGTVQIPPFLLTGRNRLSFYFDMKPSSACVPAAVTTITERIDPDSTIDLSRTPHYAPMPNLSFFANAGFPFTRLADLSESAVVMPDQIKEGDTEAFLDTMALFGESTGYPTLGAVVVQADAVNSVASRNLLLIGDYPRQRLLAAWAGRSGVGMEDGNLEIRPSGLWDRVEGVFDWRNRRSHVAAVNGWLRAAPGGEGALIGFRSPLDGRRSVVAITGTDPAHVVAAAGMLQSNQDIGRVQGDLVLTRGTDIASFRIARGYEVGSLARWSWLRWTLADQPIVIVILLFAACAALSAVAFVILGIKARRRLQGANR